ncbi:ATP-binding Cassette (ABC) Superfamily [Thraustotheca clavata]|uniref:ATP-binding Cassette (ABC) Superfamily n=1 Tax=Thraustotheca clavata TaxID=74557 RepID=A0A1V9Z0S0_9STRA|nr:ATP-binding Cassette (ABC) Superfamily [Thraustotheca clavata]
MLKTTKQSYNTFEKLKGSIPLENANLLSKLLLSWVVPLVRRGRDIELKDVWDFQDVNTCSVNTHLFQKAYNDTKSVVWSFLKVYGIQYALMGFFGLILRLMELVAPIVLNKIVQGSDDQSTMYYWIGLLFISMSAHGFVMAHCFMLEDTTNLRFQSGLKGLLFNKLLSHSLASQNAPELSNIVSADMDTIHWGLISTLDVWVLPVQILSITYLLYNQIGLAVFAGIGVIVLSLLAGGYVSFLQSVAYDNVSSARDSRMKSIKETFGAVLNVKLQAWEPQILAKLVNLRATELKYVWHLMRAGAIGILCMYASPLFVSMSSFAVYTLVLDGALTPAKIFTSLALFRMLQSPLSQVPENFTAIVEARTALRRVDEYLSQEDKPSSPPSANLPPNVAIAIKNANFSWDNSTAHLSNISLEIQKGDLVVLHGKVGSGKSSLCMAMLGEMYTMQGTMGVCGSVSYCSQEPWIQQMSLRDNILFGQQFDHEKYNRVIAACGLVVDFNLLQSGDQTIASSKGSNLSGGQKARIGLARAVYSNADIVILA